MDGFLESVKQLAEEFLSIILTAIRGFLPQLAAAEAAVELYTLLVRWIFPVLALIIFYRGVVPLLQNIRGRRLWGYLCTSDGVRIPLKNWENLIGRSRFCDIVLNLPFVSRNHAVLTFHNQVWSIADLGAKGGVEVNGTAIEEPEVVNYGDTISLAGVELVLTPAGDEEAAELQPENDSEASSSSYKTSVTLALVIIFQILGAIQLYFSMGDGVNTAVPPVFFTFILLECLHYLIARWCGRKYFELELLCYFLCGLNLFVVASAAPEELFKQLVAILLGLLAYTVIGLAGKDLGGARRLKNLLKILAFVLLVLNLTIGETYYGAKNWINLGFITFQPMEFVKIAFVMAGTATLDRLLTTRDMTDFIGFSGACLLTLVRIRDFGAAVVFFGSFIVMAFMRSGDLRTIFLATAGALFGAIAVVSFMPYIASRFATWGRAWEFANTSGFQQTRTMIAAASGGLLGVGGGNGYFANIPMADTDLVFGLLCEEWGLLVALTAVLIIVFLAVHVVFFIKSCRSSFYAIAACGAATIFLIQTALNVLGSVDIVPLTGITIPFVSNGGSSMITSWGLLAFIKAIDDRIKPG